MSVQLLAELLREQTGENLGAGDVVHFILCGPSAFMTSLTTGLTAAGVIAECIHTEEFGPQAS